LENVFKSLALPETRGELSSVALMTSIIVPFDYILAKGEFGLGPAQILTTAAVAAPFAVIPFVNELRDKGKLERIFGGSSNLSQYRALSSPGR
jgi:hypothetical protein